MTNKDDASWFADGEAYEHYVGRWSRPVGQMFLDWLDLAAHETLRTRDTALHETAVAPNWRSKPGRM
jgi:hypothetical protein